MIINCFTRSEIYERTVLFHPRQCGFAQIFNAFCRDVRIERRHQWFQKNAKLYFKHKKSINQTYNCLLNSIILKTYNPKLPIFPRSNSHILIEHLFHLVRSRPGNRRSSGWQHQLTIAKTNYN